MDLVSGVMLLSIVLAGGNCMEEELKNPQTDYAFKGCKVYRLTVESQGQLDFLHRTNENTKRDMLTNEVDFWSDMPSSLATGREQLVLVLVSPDAQERFTGQLDAAAVPYAVAIPDLARAIEEEARLSPEDAKAVENGGMTWTAYHRYATVEQYLDTLMAEYPNLVQEKRVVGQTYEGRNLYVLKVGNPRPDGKLKPAIWMDAGIHAREWIAPATLTYILNKMVTEYATNETSRRMLDEIDWYIMPVVNPDGYEFTHTSASVQSQSRYIAAHARAPSSCVPISAYMGEWAKWADSRLWRKSRRVNPFSTYLGCDPNRNYDHGWMAQPGRVSQNPNDETYAGAYPYSEVENLFITDVMLELRPQLQGMISFHSAAHMWLLPWAYGDEKPADYTELEDAAVKATDALRAVYGTNYVVGTPPDILYAAAGGTLDFSKAKSGVKYSYTPELRDPRYGFVLPPDQIIPSGIETFEAIRVIADIISAEFGPTIQ